MINKVIQMGRITHTPELKQTNTGIPVLRFSIAVDRSVADSTGERQTDFFDCVAWRKTAEFISRYFVKGDMIAIVGELQSRKYTARDNTQRIAIEIIVGEASFCGSKREKAFDPTESTAARISASPAALYADFPTPTVRFFATRFISSVIADIL